MESPRSPSSPLTQELLRTKLAAPRLSPVLLARPALLARLDQGLARKLTLLAAPAGFGKSTLVAQWLAGHRQPPRALPVAWVALDPGDNDPVRFWRYVLTACHQSFDPTASEAALVQLARAAEPGLETVLTTWINALDRLSERQVLVLEDYHLIDAPSVHSTLAFLLDYLPTTLHLILLTRAVPPLPLARLRARHELNELGVDDLRFSPDETRRFLQQVLPFALPDDAAARLAERTEGWPAGLRLTTLALESRRDADAVERFLAGFSGGHGPILDYLVEEVLATQPAEVQDFLLRTSFLSRLSGDLCDTVTEGTESARLLDHLARTNLFLIPVDEAGRWYRYHGLFAEAMHQEARRRLPPAELHALYARAAAWYDTHGLAAEAIETALAAQDFARAAAWIEQAIAPRLVRNEHHTLRRWLEALPESERLARPALAFAHAIAIQFTADRRAPETLARMLVPLERAEQQWTEAGNHRQLGAAQSLRAVALWWQGDLPATFAAAHRALALLPEDDAQWRGISLIFVALEQVMNGQTNAAWETCEAAHAANQAVENIYGVYSARHLIGETLCQQGRLGQAAEQFRQIVDTVDAALTHRDQAGFDKGWALLALGAIELEWNRLDEAEAAAAAATQIGYELAEEYLWVQATLLQARILAGRGQIPEARALLDRLVVQTPRQRWPHLIHEVQAARAALAVAAGDLVEASRWTTEWVDRTGNLPRQLQQQEALVAAQLLLAQGEAEATIHLLSPWRAEAEAQGQVAGVLETTARLALARAAAGDQAQALADLKQILAQAHAGGYRRLFLDAGAPMAELLRALFPTVEPAALADYVRGLLLELAEQAAPQETSGAAPAADALLLVEPLSPQERRVLRLLQAGLSNPEIARELVVSLNTVKTHVKNVFRKLGVNRREEAVALARRLDLP